MKEKISVVGLGKAGLPLAAVLADAGHIVVGVDANPAVVEMINRGVCHIKGEPGLQDLVRKHAGGNLVASSDAEKSSRDTRTHIVIVPLLIDEKSRPDFKYMDAAMDGVGRGLKRGDLVVLETSVPVGTTTGRLRRILEEKSGLKAGKDFHLAYSPERIMTGHSISRFREFPKVIGGLDDESAKDAYGVYSSFCNNVKTVKTIETAELVKLAEGVYRDVNIAIANELLKVSEAYGVDFWQMREAANHKYCNIHEAGCGVGGHCIPVYPQFIIQDPKMADVEPHLMETARKVNDMMAGYYAKKADVALNGVRNAKVAVVGLAFREGVDETFYTRSKPLIKILNSKGYDVHGVDPMLSGERIEKEFGATPHNGEDFSGFDCIILLNKNSEYQEAINDVRDDVTVIDCKNHLGAA